jgi:hypothetical protein
MNVSEKVNYEELARSTDEFNGGSKRLLVYVRREMQALTPTCLLSILQVPN